MSSQRKHTFYPDEAVEAVLRGVAKGGLSERVNELILKGLSLEKQEEVARAYQDYNLQLSNSSEADLQALPDRFLSEEAFRSEDEVEDFI